MDFLGLRTLTVIQDTLNLVKQTKGIDVQFDKNMNDEKYISYGKMEIVLEFFNLKVKA